MGTALWARDVTKTYRGKPPRRALGGVTFEAEEGQVLGLIGRNGAGKTTFLRIAATQLAPSSGTVLVRGRDAVREPRAVRADIAVIPQEARPLHYVSVEEHVYQYLRLRGVQRSAARARTEATLRRLGLASYRATMARSLSGGLRRRVLVAMVLASEAPVLFLDEPTTGLDPFARREVWDVIKEAVAQGRTVVLTTHYLDEAEVLSDRVVVLERGRVLARGGVRELLGRARWPYRVALAGADGLGDLARFGSVSRVGDRVLVFTTEDGAEELTRLALARGAHASAGPVTLEDLFLQLAGRPVGEDDPEQGGAA